MGESKGGTMNWITGHGPALVAFAGAAGVFVTALGIPEGDAATWLREGGVVIGIAGAVIHSYLNGRGDGA